MDETVFVKREGHPCNPVYTYKKDMLESDEIWEEHKKEDKEEVINIEHTIIIEEPKQYHKKHK